MINIKTLFMITFVLGILIISIFSILEYTYIPLVLTILIMLGYYAIAANQLNKIKSISYEQFADSNYYLGFLFTLVSLSVTLISLVQNNNIELLISQFGIAILTTLVGLSLRIYTINFVPNEETNRESFDFIISQKLQMIDEQITQTIDKNKLFSDVIDEKINMFQVKTEQNINEFTNNLLNNLDVTKLSEIISNISQSMMHNYDKQSEILEKLIEEIKNVNDSYISNIKNVNSYVSKNQNFLDTFITSINEIKEKLGNYTELVNSNTNDYNTNINNLNGLIEKQIIKTDDNQKFVLDSLLNGMNNLKNENINILDLFQNNISNIISKDLNNNVEVTNSIKELLKKFETDKNNNEKMYEMLELIKNEIVSTKESTTYIDILENIGNSLKIVIETDKAIKTEIIDNINSTTNEIKNLLTNNEVKTLDEK